MVYFKKQPSSNDVFPPTKENFSFSDGSTPSKWWEQIKTFYSNRPVLMVIIVVVIIIIIASVIMAVQAKKSSGATPV